MICQVIPGLLTMYCYYQGLQKCVMFSSYRFWMEHAPVIRYFAGLLIYVVPAVQLLLAIMLLIPQTRRAVLCIVILMQLLLIIWVTYVFNVTPYLFWPWQKSFGSYSWFYKFLECLIVAWLGYIGYRQQTKVIISK